MRRRSPTGSPLRLSSECSSTRVSHAASAGKFNSAEVTEDPPRGDARSFEGYTVKGVVLKYDRIAGYGFVASTDNPDLPDFFVHLSFIEAPTKGQRFLRVGQGVEFEPFDIEGRPQALHVKKFPTTIAVQRGDAPEAHS
jgi:cold shock CspA family protein